MKLTHPRRAAAQYAYSERDIAYLVGLGWVKEELTPEKQDFDVRELVKSPVIRKTRGPNKVKK